MTDVPEIWLATRNRKKATELQRLLPPGVSPHTLAELAGTEGFEVVEDAPDFRGNATKKASETATELGTLGVAVGALVLADDSGLCVDALGGRPGVASARYAGPDATDEDRVRKLLAELEGVPEARRTARFVCALVAVRVEGLLFFATEESCRGRILLAPSGSGGFGYDPVFVPDETPAGRESVSFAGLTAAEKDAVSHRGRALRGFVRRLEEHFCS